MYIILVAKAGILLTWGGGCVVWWLIVNRFYKKIYILLKVRKAKPISQGGEGVQPISQGAEGPNPYLRGAGGCFEIDGRSQSYIFTIFNILLVFLLKVLCQVQHRINWMPINSKLYMFWCIYLYTYNISILTQWGIVHDRVQP